MKQLTQEMVSRASFAWIGGSLSKAWIKRARGSQISIFQNDRKKEG
jgi:hypothetical protein